MVNEIEIKWVPHKTHQWKLILNDGESIKATKVTIRDCEVICNKNRVYCEGIITLNANDEAMISTIQCNEAPFHKE